jgi:hypothetical protein
MTAATLTYATLVTDTIKYAERSNDDEFIEQVPRLIMNAEDWLSREVKGLGVLEIATGALVAGNPILVKPTRWRETSYMKISAGGTTTVVKLRTLTYCQQFWPESDQMDRPMFYADYDYDHFFFAATPDTAYSLEMGYYEKPEPLCDANQSNWISTYAPTALLYAVFAEAQLFLKNYDKVNDLRSTSLASVGNIVQENRSRTSDNSGNKEA